MKITHCMQKLVRNLIKRCRLRILTGLERVFVDVVQNHDVGLTVMVQVVGKLFRVESARTHARQKEDEHQ